MLRQSKGNSPLLASIKLFMINSFRLEADCKCFLDIRILLSAFLYVFLICVRARILKTKKKSPNFGGLIFFPSRDIVLIMSTDLEVLEM